MLGTRTTRATQRVLSHIEMELHSTFHIVRAAILVALPHPKGMI
jgi:hypothetical protein